MSDEPSEDIALLDAMALGDPQAGPLFVERYGDWLWTLVCRAAPSPREREWLVGEAFAAVAREADVSKQWQGSEAIEVARIVRSCLWQWRRTRETAEYGAESESAADVEPVNGPVAPGLQPAVEALGELSAPERRGVLLCLACGLTAADAARASGTDEPSLMGSIRRVLATIARADSQSASWHGRDTDAAQRLASLEADATYRHLDDAEQTEVAALRGDSATDDDGAMERAAAAVAGVVVAHEVMPEPVRERLIDRWYRWPGVTRPRAEDPRRDHRVAGERSTRLAAYWIAAAGIVLAIIGWWPTISEQWNGAATPDERLQSLLASNAEVIRADWQAGGALKDGAVSGELVWSNQRQKGFMVLGNVPANDPQESQYQLWIFDAEREQYPVNGGVFNVPADEGSPVIPIDPDVRVNKPTLFAVTREPPGGVVVSDQERIVLTAEPGSASDN